MGRWQPRHRQMSDIINEALSRLPAPGPGESIYHVLDRTTLRGGFCVAHSPEEAAEIRGTGLEKCQITEWERRPQNE